jgi:uncharacterized protein (TIGR02266 family)
MASERDNRRHQRFPVRFQVRFKSALDFVAEYAENLSAGGLFVRGAHRLEPLSEAEVELSLPGYRQFTVRGKVAHIVSPELAATTGRRPGAGLEIVSAPDGFGEALGEYLRRLGRRRDVAVLVEEGRPLELLEAAGYRAAPLPAPNDLVVTMARSEYPVLAVVVTRAREDQFRPAATAAGVGDLVHLLDHDEELDDLLGALDTLL